MEIQMTRPTRLDTLMEIAFVIAARSTCTRLRVGALAVHDGRILSMGYNGAPIGMQHCTHPPSEICQRAIHAEANAIVWAARTGVALNGCEFICTDSPCYYCAGLMLNAGVSKVTYVREYRNRDGLVLLHGGGVGVYNLVIGKKGDDNDNYLDEIRRARDDEDDVATTVAESEIPEGYEADIHGGMV